MSMTSRGYFVEIGNTNKYMRSTIVVVPTHTPCIADTQHATADEQLQPEEAEHMYEYSPSLWDEAEAEAEEPASMLAPGGELEIELEEPRREEIDRELPPHDPPPRRLNGKQAAPVGSSRPHEPTLRTLQVGGEWVDEEHKEENRWQGEVEDTEEELMIAEHEGLLRWTREERHLAKDASTMQVMLEAEVIAQQLEQQLEDKFNRRRSIRKAWVQEKDEEEVLQTRVVSAEEVRRDLEGWKPIFQKEYEALVSGPVEAITEREVRRMQEEGVKVEILPAKAIASKKPPNRKKGRVVVCGNFAEE
jgi:hypothetical protein